jgi:hypothetical protein
MGREGGLKGGPARMSLLTEEERKELALKAIRTRWERRQEGVTAQNEPAGENRRLRKRVS